MSIAVRLESERPGPAPGSESGAARRVFPLSFAQARLWILDRFQPGNPAYNLPAATRLQGWTDANVLARSVNEIVRRHEALRTTFEVIGSRPAQVVAPALKINLDVMDLRHVLRGSAKEAKVRQIIYEQSRRGFDLAKGPLLRVSLLRLDPVDSVLMVVMHHIVSDGWSMSVFYQELSALYMAFLTGQRSPLPELPIQYPDFARWQTDWLTGDVLERHLQYWRTQLAGLRPVLDLPTDRPRPPVQSNRGDVCPFAIDRALCERLKALSQSQGATLFMTLIAAFKTLLHRLSGDTDIAVGVPIANRTQAELERLIGFFVNTLVLRTDLSGDPTFRELLAREREVALSAYAHQDMPFEKLVEELQPDRNLTHNPLFQIAFAVQNIGVVDRNARDTPPGPQPPAIGSGTAKFDLTLSLQDTGAGAQGFLEFNTDLFDASTARTMLARYHALLRAVAAQPDRRLSQLSILTEAERTAEVSGRRGPKPEIPPAETILRALRRHAHTLPDAAAFDGGGLSYAELNRRVNQLARGLRRAGVAPGEAVAIAMTPGGDALVATLGILAAGGVYVPIDPSELGGGSAAIPGRLAELFADLGQAPVVVDEATAARVPAHSVRALLFRELAVAGQEDGSHEPEVDPSAEAVASFVYQSTPSGGLRRVPLTHHALCRAAAHPAIQLRSSDRVAHLSHPSSNRARLEIFGTLAAGGTIVPVGEEHQRSPRKLATALRDLRITVLFASPASMQRLAREFPWALRTVRLLLTDEPAAWRLREGLKPDVLERMFVLSGDAGAGGYFAVQPLASIPPDATAALVGEPAAGMTLLVLDASLDPVPAGVPGELCVETDLPPSDRPSPVRYRTGDLVRQLADGALEYRGRRDGRLLLGGLPVHPAGIEAALALHAGAREAGVGLRYREGGRAAGLAALVVVADGGRVTADELRAFAAERLPAPMIPSVLYFVEALPRARDGSLDRRALDDEIAALDDPKTVAEPYLAPRTDVETTLAQIWMETLGTDRVGVKDHFFRLGGHSLLASQVVARISDAFDVEFPLQHLFEAPTVEQLARRLEPVAGSHRTPQVRGIAPVPRDKPLPLSFAQQRLWFLDQFEPGSAFYNIAMPVRMAAAIDSGALQAAFNDLVARHETLRTTFAMVDGQPVQVIAPSCRLSMPVHDLRHVTETERQAETQRLAALDARKPFDLKNGPVLRAELIRLGDADHVLLLTIHHIAADGGSTDILFRELMAFYEARWTGRPADLPELQVQYADFACWQRRWLTGTVLDRQLTYWKRQLAGAPALFELPTDRPRPRIQTFSGGMYRMSMPASLLDGVRRLSEREENTLFTTLLSAFKALLYRYTGIEDVVVGSPIANRGRPELEPLIGFFANTLVLRTRLSPALTFRGVMERVREVALAGYAHQDIPFEKLVEELHPERNLGYNPLFQLMFALQNTGRQGAASAASGGASPIIGAGVAKFDLTMFVSDGADGSLHVGLEYNSDLFDAATMVRFAEHYEALLTAAVADPDQPIWALPILSSAEIVALAEWNDTAAPFDRTCVHRLFEARAARSPQAEALVFDGRALSYGELNAQANIWAHRLIDLGVAVGGCVAICMERSIEMIVRVIAALKAGAAYVPIDPKYPKDRIAFMLADSRAPVVLTQPHLADRLPATSSSIVVMDTDEPDAASNGNPSIPVSADGLAYVIYTSGSTGRPKGVAMPHAPLSNLVQWQIARGPLTDGARTLQFASISFDVSFQEIFSTLCAGGSLVLIDEERRRDPAALWHLLGSERISRLFLPYVALQQLAEEAKHVADLPATLTEVITAGEQLQITPQIATLFRRLSAFLYNQYGPSESHVVTELQLAGTPSTWPARPAIGRPLPNATIHVLDPFGQPCTVGTPGELHIGGDALARGYIHREDLTAERFIPDAVGTTGGRLYRTGDRARYLADGTIEFLGRIDDQVKIRGFRVEPAEVEVLLRAHPGVQEAVVVAVRRSADEMQLIAYAQPDPAHTPSIQQLRTYLGTLLPDYMMPSAFVVIAALPLTPSGKLDRRALLNLQPAPAAPVPKVVAQTPVEQALARIWCDVLQLAQVDVHANFFELGGHSLLATRVTSRVRDQFGVELPVRRMFEAPTIQALALSVVELTLEAQSADEMARLLAEIEQMSEDEARTLVRGDQG